MAFVAEVSDVVHGPLVSVLKFTAPRSNLCKYDLKNNKEKVILKMLYSHLFLFISLQSLAHLVIDKQQRNENKRMKSFEKKNPTRNIWK